MPIINASKKAKYKSRARNVNCVQAQPGGGLEGIRTLDFYNANVALSQLSYRPVNPIIITRGV